MPKRTQASYLSPVHTPQVADGHETRRTLNNSRVTKELPHCWRRVEMYNEAYAEIQGCYHVICSYSERHNKMDSSLSLPRDPYMFHSL